MTKQQLSAIFEAINTGNVDYIKNLPNDHTDWLIEPFIDASGAEALAIHHACKQGKLEIVQLILDKKPDHLNITDKFNQTPLRFAAAKGHVPLVDYLLKLGADQTITTNCPKHFGHGYRPIHWAAMRGHHAVVQCFINNRADITMLWGEMRFHLIHIASQLGELEVVKTLLKEDPNLLNTPDAYGQTPVLWAANKNHEALVDYLASLGADLTLASNRPDHAGHGYRPIHWAANRGHHKIVQCLTKHRDDINIRVGKDQFHSIHIASKEGQLEVVQTLLDTDPSLLNLTDAYGQTPILWAAARGHAAVVAYLLSKNANLDHATNQPGHKGHGRTALNWAMEEKHYEAANLIFLKTNTDQSYNAILPFVQDGEQALWFMILEPASIKVLLQDDRIVGFINAINCNITEQSIQHYIPSGRRPSCYMHINKQSKTSSLFKPVKELGSGAYGLVRLFQSADNQQIGVKSLRLERSRTDGSVSITDFKRQKLGIILKREAEFNKRAYPNDSLSEPFEFNDGQTGYTNRFVIDFIKGETINTLLPKISSPHQLAEIILKIAQETLRIHNIGIIHGDLKLANIMTNNCDNNDKIRIIDFGLSCDITESCTSIFNVSAVQKWMPPEVCTDQEIVVKPHPNQDIYTLGCSLNYTLKKNKSYEDLIRLFPSIPAFILAAQNKNPLDRPSLESFCKLLSDELNQTPEIEAVAIETNPIENTVQKPKSPLVTYHLLANSQKNTTPDTDTLIEYKPRRRVQCCPFM